MDPTVIKEFAGWGVAITMGAFSVWRAKIRRRTVNGEDISKMSIARTLDVMQRALGSLAVKIPGMESSIALHDEQIRSIKQEQVHIRLDIGDIRREAEDLRTCVDRMQRRGGSTSHRG